MGAARRAGPPVPAPRRPRPRPRHPALRHAAGAADPGPDLRRGGCHRRGGDRVDLRGSGAHRAGRADRAGPGGVVGDRPRWTALCLPSAPRSEVPGRRAFRRLGGEVLPGPGEGAGVAQRPEGLPQRHRPRGDAGPLHRAASALAAFGGADPRADLGRRGHGLAPHRGHGRHRPRRHRPFPPAAMAARRFHQPGAQSDLLGTAAAP